ncbi:PREDICTED: uncharacterized protein LOC108358592 [Rhagoletis zephyria]|uniref:uncharacterized protein LOC108358592 n=1 Tax=Rhagoletis zephyria TaxID=28612 RepID=UPI00081148E9|nr:PREDICTED: uncharacterized protein LOC108358592 [Rhagoletis zephyria]
MSLYQEKKETMEKEGLYLFATDASIADDCVGCAIHDICSDTSYMYKLNEKFSSTFGELCAIRQAVRIAKRLKLSRIGSFTDSAAAVKLLEQDSTNNFVVAEVHNEVCNSSIHDITICWVPSHVGIGFNEKADLAAKTAVDRGLVMESMYTFQEAITRIRDKIWNDWNVEYQNTCLVKGKTFAQIQPSVTRTADFVVHEKPTQPASF